MLGAVLGRILVTGLLGSGDAPPYASMMSDDDNAGERGPEFPGLR